MTSVDDEIDLWQPVTWDLRSKRAIEATVQFLLGEVTPLIQVEWR